MSRAQSTYVSPSDNIMSPCTKKLSDLKGKRFKKYIDLFPTFDKLCSEADIILLQCR